MFLEGHSSKLAGSPFPAWLTKSDARFPSNVNDSDLTPAMSEVPASKLGITEMTFCSLRHETILLLRNAPTFEIKNEDGSTRPCTLPELLKLKDQAIVNLQEIFEKKYLQYCDPSIPLQLVILLMAKSVISTMKVMAHHPRNYPDRGASMSQEERNMVFEQCLMDIELHTLSHENEMIQGYTWHNHVYFQFDGFIFLLTELRVRTTGADVDTAWLHIEKVYKHRPEMISDSRNLLYVAIGGLVLKAWAKRELALNAVNSIPPRYISQLRSQKSGSHSKSSTQSPSQDQMLITPPQILPTTRYQSDPQLAAPQYPTNPLSPWEGQTFDYGLDANFNIPLTDTPATDWDYWLALMAGEVVAGCSSNSVNMSWG